MEVQKLSQEDMLALASKVLDSEEGLKKLQRDVQARASGFSRDVVQLESDMDRIKLKLAATVSAKQNWDTFSAILGGLTDKWNIKDVATLTTKPQTEENPDGAPAPQKMSPEAQKRLDEKKLCMFRDQKGKKWCPITLSAKIKKAGDIYCTKHQRIVNGG